jgi:hypothetical protein
MSEQQGSPVDSVADWFAGARQSIVLLRRRPPIPEGRRKALPGPVLGPYAAPQDLVTGLREFGCAAACVAAGRIATNSVRELPGGWGWKFDPKIFSGAPRLPRLAPLKC